MKGSRTSTGSSRRASEREPLHARRLSHLDISEGFEQALLAFIDPVAVHGLKVVLDGGNGMAGPMVGPVLEGWTSS